MEKTCNGCNKIIGEKEESHIYRGQLLCGVCYSEKLEELVKGDLDFVEDEEDDIKWDDE